MMRRARCLRFHDPLTRDRQRRDFADRPRKAMFDNVLIGVDGRSGGRDAIALAKRLAAANASFTLAHVDADGPASWWSHHVGEERVFDRSASMLARERERAAISADIVCVAGEAPERALLDLAAQRAPDLIVVGSSRRGPRGRILVRHHVLASLHAAPCATAIAPRGCADNLKRFREIGVAYDGSPGGELALATAREIASHSGAAVRALWVVSPADVRDEEPIPANGASAVVVRGARAQELSRLSRRVDLLIVGAGTHGLPRRRGRGSVLRDLAASCACPLLVAAPALVGVGSAVLVA